MDRKVAKYWKKKVFLFQYFKNWTNDWSDRALGAGIFSWLKKKWKWLDWKVESLSAAADTFAKYWKLSWESFFRELEEAVGKFEEWSASLRRGEKPHQKEVQTFLWLMWSIFLDVKIENTKNNKDTVQCSKIIYNTVCWQNIHELCVW